MDYWSKNHHRGPDWYVGEFPPGEYKVHAEVAVGYFGDGEALVRMARDLRDVRLVVSLRNPYERAWSHYWDSVRAGRFRGPRREAILHLPYITEDSRYATHLKTLMRFFSREQLFVALYEQIAVDPSAALQAMYEFIGVDHEFLPPHPEQRVNVGRRPSAAEDWLLRLQKLVKGVGVRRKHLLSLGIWDPLAKVYGWLARRKPTPLPSAEELTVLDGHLRSEVQELSELLERPFRVASMRVPIVAVGRCESPPCPPQPAAAVSSVPTP